MIYMMTESQTKIHDLLQRKWEIESLLRPTQQSTVNTYETRIMMLKKELEEINKQLPEHVR